MKRFCIVAIVFITCLSAVSQPASESVGAFTDSVSSRPSFFKRTLTGIGRFVAGLNEVDTLYIEPQKYRFTTMVQTTYTYDSYILDTSSNQTIHFSPKASIRIGPYFGWKLIFLGYTIGFSQISIDTKKDITLSLYSPAIGLDIFYRRMGTDYTIQDADFGVNVDVGPLRGEPFTGLKVGMTGFNLYYISNHRQFSYPAAFSQSSRQLQSCGSLIFGIGYTRNTLDLDYEKLQKTIKEHLPHYSVPLDSAFMLKEIKYHDYSLSAGYAYNYVFAKNWLLGASFSLALGYKHSTSHLDSEGSFLRNLSLDNFNIDWVGRLAVVWNTSKWYAGASAIMHSYNYRKSQFKSMNYFGNVNVYFGVNFGRKKHHQ